MFEKDEVTNKVKFSHNPFSMPQGDIKNIDFNNPLNIKAYQYDIVCNGVELSSGAIRNHLPQLMYKLFSIAGYDKKQVDENITKNSFVLVDARSRERFEGKMEEPRPGLKKGYIPGSKNIPFQDCINSETNTFKTKSELIKIFVEKYFNVCVPFFFVKIVSCLQ